MIHSSGKKGPSYNAANISFASSGVGGEALSLAPGASARRPKKINVLVKDQPSGTSSWTATYPFLSAAHDTPMPLTIFWIVASLTKSTSRRW